MLDFSYELNPIAKGMVTSADIKELIVEMREGFRRMDERFEAVDKRFEQVDKRFDDFNRRFSQMQWLIGLGLSLMTILIAVLRVFG
ncbi:MAG: hypothetical protein JSR44_09605, partial [Spirochaetes bacterium]|nr:hypothetical protein [Spirochaetota bacterium]